MLKGAICFFAFYVFLFGCATKMTHAPFPAPAPSQSEALPDFAPPDISLSEGDVELPGEEEANSIVESEEKVTLLVPSTQPKSEAPVESLELPDMAITDLFLDPKKRLVVAMANIGNGPLPAGNGSLMIFVDGQLKGNFPLSSLSGRSFFSPKEGMTFTTPLSIFGRHEIQAHVDTGDEIREWDKENNRFERTLEGPPAGPDVLVKDLDLTEDLDLSIVLSNAGEVDVRRGATFRIRVFLNDRKISEFEHFTSEALSAHSGNLYTLGPPYPVGITGISRVKVSISPRRPSDDVRLENNVFERTFVVFPFRIGSQGREEFSFSFLLQNSKEGNPLDKVKAEARWEGGGSTLGLSFTESGQVKGAPALSGKSPLKVEFPIDLGEVRKERVWKVSVINLVEKKVEGHLIIQHP